MAMAAADPMTMAFLCWAGGSDRAASAMTTALSPDRRMLTQMISARASQKTDDHSSISMSLARPGSL
jgi:hypothetical protein